METNIARKTKREHISIKFDGKIRFKLFWIIFLDINYTRICCKLPAEFEEICQNLRNRRNISDTNFLDDDFFAYFGLFFQSFFHLLRRFQVCAERGNSCSTSNYYFRRILEDIVTIFRSVPQKKFFEIFGAYNAKFFLDFLIYSITGLEMLNKLQKIKIFLAGDMIYNHKYGI